MQKQGSTSIAKTNPIANKALSHPRRANSPAPKPRLDVHRPVFPIHSGEYACSHQFPTPPRRSPACGSVLHSECAGEVVLGLGVTRFQAKGLLVMADGLVNLAFPGQLVAQAAMGLGVIRF